VSPCVSAVFASYIYIYINIYIYPTNIVCCWAGERPKAKTGNVDFNMFWQIS